MKEIWKSIVNYEVLYEISNWGKIKRFYKNTRNKFRSFKILKLYKRPDGRMEVGLSKNGNEKNFLVHRLVLETFIGPCPPGLEGCHNDGNEENNFIDNLRWDTHKNNVQDSIKHCTINKGSKRPASKLNEKQVRIIKWLLKDGYLSQKEIAKIFDVSSGIISAIKCGKAWKHVVIQ